MDFAGEHELAEEIRRQALTALADAELAVLVVDARAGLRPGDAELAARAARRRRAGDRGGQQGRRRAPGRSREPSSTGSGLGDPLPVSATQGLGTGDLLDLIVERLPEAGAGRRGDASRGWR